MIRNQPAAAERIDAVFADALQNVNRRFGNQIADSFALNSVCNEKMAAAAFFIKFFCYNVCMQPIGVVFDHSRRLERVWTMP